jgi:hypothetical protein
LISVRPDICDLSLASSGVARERFQIAAMRQMDGFTPLRTDHMLVATFFLTRVTRARERESNDTDNNIVPKVL